MKHLKIKLISLVAMGCMLVPYQSSTSKGGPSGGGKGGGGSVGGSCTVKEKNAVVGLQFPFSYSGRNFGVIPEPNSNPDHVRGGTTFSNSSSTFYCKVTVEGVNCPGYSKTYTWKEQSREMEIPIPTNTDYTITVKFYESCGAWDDNVLTAGRPYYEYFKRFSTYLSFIPANLDYLYTTTGCSSMN